MTEKPEKLPTYLHVQFEKGGQLYDLFGPNGLPVAMFDQTSFHLRISQGAMLLFSPGAAWPATFEEITFSTKPKAAPKPPTLKGVWRELTRYLHYKLTGDV